MPLSEAVIVVALGVLCVFLGWLVWKKGKISLLHSYHYKRVRQEDFPVYTAIMGKETIRIGMGLIGLAAINFALQTQGGWLWFGICFSTALLRMHMAQKKYNGGWF